MSHVRGSVPFVQYAAEIEKTDVLDPSDLNPVLLGLYGEVGGIMATAKKHVREGERYPGYLKAALEEFGDAGEGRGVGRPFAGGDHLQGGQEIVTGGGALAQPALVATGLSGLFWGMISYGMKIPVAYGLLYPLGALMAIYIVLRSTWRGERRVEWRGRVYGTTGGGSAP